MNETEIISVQFDEGCDDTHLGYNTSMNFWFVGGEVRYNTSLTLPEAEDGKDIILYVQAKPPVNEWVNTELRLSSVGENGETITAVIPGNELYTYAEEIAFTLTEYAGMTLDAEFAFVWDQASLVTIVLKSPAAELRVEEHIELPAVTEEPVIKTAEVTETPAPEENTVETVPETQESIAVPAPAAEKSSDGTMILPAIAILAIAAWIGIRKALKKR